MDCSVKKNKQYFTAVKNSIGYYVCPFLFVSSICGLLTVRDRYNMGKIRVLNFGSNYDIFKFLMTQFLWEGGFLKWL